MRRDGVEPITWATFAGAASTPMGLQHYELQILEALAARPNNDWSFVTRRVGSVRSRGKADVHLEMGILKDAHPAVARGLGRWAYRGARLVHRFDLRLPPAHVPEILTIHDLPPLRFTDEGELPRWSITTARDARLIVCPSAFAAAEVSALLAIEPAKVVVVPNGVSPLFSAARLSTLMSFRASGSLGPTSFMSEEPPNGRTCTALLRRGKRYQRISRTRLSCFQGRRTPAVTKRSRALRGSGRSATVQPGKSPE